MVHWTAPSRRRAPSPFWPPVWVLLLLSLGLWALIWAAVSLLSAYALQEAKQRPDFGVTASQNPPFLSLRKRLLQCPPGRLPRRAVASATVKTGGWQ